MSAFEEALPNIALLLGVLFVLWLVLMVGDYLGQRRRHGAERAMTCLVSVQHVNRGTSLVTCSTHEVSWDARVRGWLCPNRGTLVVGRKVSP